MMDASDASIDSSPSEAAQPQADSLRAFFEKNGDPAGSVDVLALPDAHPLARVGELCALLRFMSAESKQLFDRVVVANPPADRAGAEAAIRTAFRDVVNGLGATSVSDVWLDSALSTVELHFVADLSMEALSPAMDRIGTGVALVVSEATVFRDPTLDAGPGRGDTDEAQWPVPGDRWAPHVIALLERVRQRVEARGGYAMIALSEALPARPSYRDAIMKLASAVLGCDVDADDVSLSAAFARWASLAAEGRLSEAFREIDTYPDLNANGRLRARLPLLQRVGMTYAVRAIFTAHPELGNGLAPSGRLRLAMVAEAADANDEARHLLDGALDALDDVEDLEAAFELAATLGPATLQERAQSRLTARFPASVALLMDRAETLTAAGRYRDALRTLGTLPPHHGARVAEYAAYLRLLVKHVEAVESPNIEAFLRDVASEAPGHVVHGLLFVADRLSSAGDRVGALDLLRTASVTGDRDTLDRAALRIIREGTIAGDASLSADVVDPVAQDILRRAAQRPGDTQTRVDFGRTFDATVLGITGLALIAHVAIGLAALSQIRAVENDPPTSNPEDMIPLVRGAAQWLGEMQGHVPGTIRLPQSLLGAHSPESVLRGLRKLLSFRVSEMRTSPEPSELSLFMAVACAIAPWSPATTADLDILRLAGLAFARRGDVQQARDYAELALQIAVHREPHVRRQAWYVYADIYGRIGNRVEALTAAACMLASDAAVSWLEALEESLLLARLFRDLGLYEYARPFLHRARQAQQEGALPGGYSLRLDMIELHLDLASAVRQERTTRRSSDFSAAGGETLSPMGGSRPDAQGSHHSEHDAASPGEALEVIKSEAAGFVARAADLVRETRAAGDELVPAVSALASALARATVHGATVDPAVEQLYREARADIDADSGRVLDLVYGAPLSTERIAGLARRLEVARFRDDVGYDVHQIVFFARQLLETNAALDAEVAIYAIECLSDLGASPTSDLPHPRLIDDPRAPAATARELAQGNLSIVLLAQRDGDVCRVSASGGSVGAVAFETPPVCSVARLGEWRQSYPQGYRDAPAQMFFTSTDGIGLSELPERAVIVADTRLQAFPPNLWNIGEALAGQRAHLALAPSLQWLSAARRHPFRGDARRLAWIPANQAESPFEPLAVLAGELGPTLEQHGVQLTTDVQPPPAVRGAELLIVAAHGNLTSDAHFFRALQDDAALVLSPTHAARVLSGAGTVVLFVCSGGRVTRHLEASTMVGIARLLLDQGCRAVIAPPWPLSVGVPPRWLPVFLSQWDAGAAAIDATFEANRAVARTMGEEPAASLAMTVYGDPEMRAGG